MQTTSSNNKTTSPPATRTKIQLAPETATNTQGLHMSQNTYSFAFAPTSLLLSQAGLEISQYKDMSGIQTQNPHSWNETPAMRATRLALLGGAENAQDARFGLLTEGDYEENRNAIERMDSMSPASGYYLPEQGMYYPSQEQVAGTDEAFIQQFEQQYAHASLERSDSLADYESDTMQNAQLDADIMQMQMYSVNPPADIFAPQNLCPDAGYSLADFGYPVDDDMLDYSSSSVSAYDCPQVPGTPPVTPVYVDYTVTAPAFLFLKHSDFPTEDDDDEDMLDAHDCSAAELDCMNMIDNGIAQVLKSMNDKKTAREIRELADNGQ